MKKFNEELIRLGYGDKVVRLLEDDTAKDVATRMSAVILLCDSEYEEQLIEIATDVMIDYGHSYRYFKEVFDEAVQDVERLMNEVVLKTEDMPLSCDKQTKS